MSRHPSTPLRATARLLPCRKRQVHRAGVLGIIAVLTGTPALSDGSFVQLDVGRVNQGLVASVATGNLGFSLAASNYEDGRSLVLSATYGFDIGGLGTLKLGPALGIRQDDGTPTETEIGARLSLERYVSTDFGGVFGLAEIGSIDESWFLLGQVVLRDGLGIEISRGGSDTYTETTIAVQHQLGDGPLRLRLGYRAEDKEVFVGLSYSTF